MEEGPAMSMGSYAGPVETPAIRVPAWAWALAALALFSLYVLSQENGALLSASGAQYLHELTHDGRHALGVPCH
jgi:hypothetical protein